MRNSRRPYFLRLLSSFLAGGFMPLVILSITLGATMSRVLEGTQRNAARAAVEEAADRVGSLFADASRVAGELAGAAAIGSYATARDRGPGLVAECNRLLSASAATSSFYPYVIPLDGGAPLSRSAVPVEYDPVAYRGWGLVGELLREGGSSPVVLLAQPHPDAARTISLAAGTRIYDGERIAALVIVDVGRKALVDRIGASAARSGAALASLSLADPSGCVAYDSANPLRESAFIDLEGQAAAGFMVARSRAPSGFEVYGMFSREAARGYSSGIVALTSIVGAASVALSLAMAFLLSRSIARPVHELTLTMDLVSEGRLDSRCPEPTGPDSGGELGALVRQFNRMVGRVGDLVENKVAQERELRNAEIKALEAQINPHFLYNTLNSLRAAANLQGATEIADVVTRLARIMREGAFSGAGFCTLARSLELARDYFEIESWRWPGRFRLVEDVDPALRAIIIPRLMVQPLVENALTHGLEAKAGEGELRIEARLEGSDAVIAISDDGAGIPRERLDAILLRLEEAGADPFGSSLSEGEGDEAAGGRNGIALLNTHRRLRLIYGPEYGLSISSVEGAGTTTTIRLPAGPKEASACSS